MKQLVIGLFMFALLAVIVPACSDGAAATKSNSNDPVVTSTDENIWGAVVQINGFTYNCVYMRYGSVGVALSCDRVLDPQGRYVSNG